MTLRYGLRSPSGLAVDSIDVLIDGRPVSGGRGLARVDSPAASADDDSACPAAPGARGLARIDLAESEPADGLNCSVTLTLPPRDVEISFVARSGDLASEPATLLLAYRGTEAPTGDALAKPRLYALVVGVSDYEIAQLRLEYAGQDARDMAEALKAQEGGLYSAVDVRLLADREATRGAILEGLEWLDGEVTQNDVGLLFMAGHGVTDPKQRFYFVSADGDPERLLSTAVSGDAVQQTISSLAGKALFFIDACHSAAGLVSTAQPRSAIDITGVVNELSAAENGVVMFSSSTGREVSVEDQRWQNAFTEALLEAFAGKGDFTCDGAMSIAELDLYLSERVKELTEQQQHPVVRKPDIIPDFEVALVR